jgi:hypothetical protein
MIGRVALPDGGPGHIRVRQGLSPYEKVILRANHYPVRQARTDIEIGANITAGIWWHRHYVPFAISLNGYCVVATRAMTDFTLTAKMALYTADATTMLPASLVAATDVEWADADFEPTTPGDDVDWTGRYKKLGAPVAILTPGVYWVGIRPNSSGTILTTILPRFLGEQALDPSLLNSNIGGAAERMYDVSTTGTPYSDPWPANPTVVAARESIANIAVGLLCNRLF